MCPFCVSFFCFLFVCSSTVVVASSDIPADEKDEISLLLKILKDHRTSMNTSATVESTETTNRLQVETENPLKSYSCPENEFYCGVEDTCIESIRLCDGGLDCSDGSDEVDCFECKYDFPHGRLIRTDQVCDGVSDCRHGEDEHACKTSCGNAEFACNEGDIGTACIPDEWKCDSVPDCPDIEDESVQLCGERLGKCGVDQFVCGHRLFCIPEIWRCDGEQDCGDHSDEDDCDEDGVDRQHSMTNASRFEWGDWGIWSSCNSNCDGERTRSRKCRFGDCVGKRDDVQTCGDSYPCVTEPSKGCGTRVFEVPSGRVVGGRDAQLNEWPWQVQIFRPGRAIPFCGGSLIKQSWVLTVAHCFYRKKFSADEYFVAVGRRHTSRRLADDDEQYVHVRSIIINEEYDKPSHMNDIALLRLQKEVTVNHGANLVCLPPIEASWLKDDQQKSLDCFVTGFGVNQMGRRPATMQEAKVNLIDRKTCRKPYVYGNRITESMICAGHMQGGIDACQGDSGGPLVCQHPEEGRWYQVGITSWGKGCGLPNRPGVYTYVSSFHRWIHANLLDPSDMQK